MEEEIKKSFSGDEKGSENPEKKPNIHPEYPFIHWWGKKFLIVAGLIMVAGIAALIFVDDPSAMEGINNYEPVQRGPKQNRTIEYQRQLDAQNSITDTNNDQTTDSLH